MNWRDHCGDKLVSAQEAVGCVRNGDSVQFNWLHATPLSLCEALLGRKEELREVKIGTIGPLFDWEPTWRGPGLHYSDSLPGHDHPSAHGKKEYGLHSGDVLSPG